MSAYPPRSLPFLILFEGDPPTPFRSMSGIGNTVTLHAVLLAPHSKLRQWCESRPADPRTVTVQLLDEAGAVTTSWTYTNARPVRTTGALGSPDQESAVESIELAVEQSDPSALR